MCCSAYWVLLGKYNLNAPYPISPVLPRGARLFYPSTRSWGCSCSGVTLRESSLINCARQLNENHRECLAARIHDVPPRRYGVCSRGQRFMFDNECFQIST